MNVIPPNRINQALLSMLANYVAEAQHDDGDGHGGMTMMGQPTVVGAGNDANNYLDVRNEVHYTDQGTLRFDHDFVQGVRHLFVTAQAASMDSCRRTCLDSGTS